MKPLIKIFNGKLVLPDRIIQRGTVLVSGKEIVEVAEGDIDVTDATEINAGENYISPGFIDIHVHGGGGADFMDGEVKGFLQIANTHCRYGTSAMYPTTLSADKASLLNMLKVYEEASKQNTAGSTFLGVHLEGPYFAMNQRGAQDPKYIRDPDPEEYKEVIASSKQIRRWSAAPELKGAIELGNYLCKNGILPAIAHTDALYEEVMDAFENGYELVTHLYSAMSGVTRRDAYRYAGTIESAFLIDGLSVEIVADGKHLPAPLLKLVYKIKGPDRIVLITDAMRAAGENTTESILGNIRSGLKVIIEDGVAKLPDRSAFAGSVATADRLVRTMINIADVPLYDAVKMMTATPAAIMKISNKKGSLRRGKDADIIIFDKDINVNMTMVEGKIVYTQP
jgi:N-acetylglucosamine-6-phosphate deacetylase